MKRVKLVATVERVRLLLPEAFAKRFGEQLKENPSWGPCGPISGDFPIDPDTCQTKFGRWLAEKVPTTRYDDDFSCLFVTLPFSEEDLHVREALGRFARHRLRCQDDFERFQAEVQAWLDKRKRVVRMYGADSFDARVINFSWPVFGSRASGGQEVATPEAYFDSCARRILSLAPVRVRHYASGEEPPSLPVASRADFGVLESFSVL